MSLVSDADDPDRGLVARRADEGDLPSVGRPGGQVDLHFSMRDRLGFADGAAVVWQPASAGGALGMESHVAKRTIAIGDAGGFD